MTQADPQIPEHASRLLRFLAELGVADTAVSHTHFTVRLGQMFDLPDSIRIAAVHDKRTSAACGHATPSPEEVKKAFLRGRAAIVNTALQSFVPGGGSIRLRFPQVTAGGADEQATTAAPYLAFYASMQREIDFRIRQLQAETRRALTELSPRLAQLAALDAALGDPLSGHGKRFFPVVGELLGKRLKVTLEHDRQSTADGQHKDLESVGTLAQLRAEMQGLLLAEIETRLLPTLGLIEALDEPENE